MSELITVTGTVLSKTDYSESSVIATVLTAECGLVKFIIKGDRRLSKKHLPQVDILRCLSLSFHHKEEYELQLPSAIEYVGGYESIASNYHAYCCALWICRFIERNLHPFHPVPELMELFDSCLRVISVQKDKKHHFSVLAGFIIGFLSCEGMLPENYLESTGSQLKPFYQLVLGESVLLPELTNQDIHNLSDWCTATLNSFHLKNASFPDSLF